MDNRSPRHDQNLLDIFPNLEYIAKLYALEGCKRKSASFSSLELAQYVDKQYYESIAEVRDALVLQLNLKRLISVYSFNQYLLQDRIVRKK